MIAVLVLHVALALAAGLLGKRLGRRVLLLAAVGPVAALVAIARATPDVLDGEVLELSLPWAASLGLGIDLRLDGFGLLFWWIIAGIGLLVFLYAARYFAPDRKGLGRFASMLTLFCGAMLLLTAADNVFLMFVAWELTSVTSYFLIGFEDDRAAARAAALQALLVTGAGGLALLGGLVLLAQAAGTSSLAGILAVTPSGTAVSVGLGLVLLAAMTKSAQAPFHFWLPGAMAAPTPVSAYLHSATMVKAGVYLVARFGPAFAPHVDWWQPTLIAVGATSLLLGGYRALRATDLKALLAYGTISQLGFLVVLVGSGHPEYLHAGIALLLAHSVFKAALFLTAGVVDHQAHTRDLRRLDGMWRVMPVTAAVAAIAAASMAGVAPLLGFVAKEAALEATLHAGLANGLVTALVVAGATLTVAYGLRFVWGGFAGKSEDHLGDDVVGLADVARPALAFELPAVVLGLGTVVLGLWIGPVDALVGAAAASLSPGVEGLHLALWHGFGAPLGLSVLALGVGAALFLWPRVLAPLQGMTSRGPDMAKAYRSGLVGLNRVADRITSIVQSGSLPVYLGTILATLLVLPGSLLVAGFDMDPGMALADTPLQVAVGMMVAAAAIGTAVVRQRLAAVLLLGAVGYGVAVLFLIQGAPDLALTQLLVETLVLGIFVLVLRRLPERFEQPAWRLGRGLRVVLSVGVGVFVGALALVASAARTGGTQAEEFLARALPDGGGKNVVNVILTDFRALDTLGEITVLLVASVGVVALVRGARRRSMAELKDEA